MLRHFHLGIGRIQASSLMLIVKIRANLLLKDIAVFDACRLQILRTWILLEWCELTQNFIIDVGLDPITS